jgi:hypothetical protein
MESSNVNSNIYHQQNTYQVQQNQQTHHIQQAHTKPVQIIYRTEYTGYAEPMVTQIIIESEPNDSNETNMEFEKSESPKSNPRPIKHYDGNVVANQFINYFYQTWMTKPTTLITDDVIKPYSKLKYLNQVYDGESFIEVLKGFVSTGIQFTDCNFEILDSGSRQIYILVTGIIKNDLTLKHFSQTFMIAYAGENNKKSLRKWTLMNSILIVQ